MSLSIFFILTALPLSALGQGFARVGTVQVWDTIFAGARSQSLGESNLSTLQDPTDVLDNPAVILDTEGLTFGYDRYDYLFDIQLQNYGEGVRLGDLTVLAGARTMQVDQVVRTAYDPEGTGEIVRVRNRVLSLAANYDLAPWVLPEAEVVWTVGLAYRHSSGKVGESGFGQGDLDAGTTFRLRQILDIGILEYSAAVVGTNILGNTNDDIEYPVAQVYHFL